MNFSLYWYRVEILKIVDGDTIHVKANLGFGVTIPVKVRIKGIDTPEVYGVKQSSDEYARGKIASARLAELLEGRDVLINTFLDKTGKYGRYIADVCYEDGSLLVNVGDILVEEGLAERKDY